MDDASPREETPPAAPSVAEVAAWILGEAEDLIAIANGEGELLYLNGAARAALGLAPDAALTGRTLPELQPAWAWHLVEEEGIPGALATGSWSGESAALLQGGREIPVAQRLLVSATGPHRRLVSIMRDLSERKRRELERLETVNRYETAIRLSGHVLLDWEPFTGDMTCSGDLHGLLGRDPSELTAGSRTLRSYVHPEDLALFDEAIQRTVTTRQPLVLNFRLMHRDGQYRDIRAGGGFYLDREGRFGRITVLMTSIDFVRHAREEIARLEAQLELGVEEQVRLARAETEQARQAKNEFLSRMSHELRTPLNAILGFTQLLELETPTPNQQESIEHIARAGQHLLSLINEVLDFSRLESGRLPLNLESVPLEPVVKGALEQIRPAAEREQISLVLAEECLTPELRVVADQQRLRQVVQNILSNAVKFNRRGGTVTVYCRPGAQDRLRLGITDTGLGMSGERLSRLFTPMIRDPLAGHERSGVGLGLALARGIVRAMNGELSVESVQGEGSTFWLDLPRAGAELPVTAAPDIPPPPPALVQRTIVYVEDEVLNLELVRRTLADYPEYRLLTLETGKGALELVREQRPDLILLDLNLPDLSGETVLARLKDDPGVRNIPVIMVTADVIGHRLERLLEAGAAAYLTKPFKLSELIRAIRDTLAGKLSGGGT
jgi:signal transduction histidine kinase/ActR/RegA family two-component response regulator